MHFDSWIRTATYAVTLTTAPDPNPSWEGDTSSIPVFVVGVRFLELKERLNILGNIPIFDFDPTQLTHIDHQIKPGVGLFYPISCWLTFRLGPLNI